MNEKRVFLAILLSIDDQHCVEQLINELKKQIDSDKVKWTASANLHVTLRFIKKISKDQLTILVKGLTLMLKNRKTFSIKTHKLMWFPDHEKTKTLAVMIEPDQVLDDIVSEMGQLIKTVDLPVDTRPFKGHISLARLVKPLSPEEQTLKLTDIQAEKSIKVNEIYLIESQPKEGKTHYQILDTIQLLQS